jgi:hypothetical protein
MNVLMQLLLSDAWRDIWVNLNLSVRTFADLSLDADVPDADLWHVCQKEEVVLITGNRNKESDDSLEATINAHNTPASLPVLTLSDPDQFVQSRAYANRVVETLLQFLLGIDNVRGTGRLWLP